MKLEVELFFIFAKINLDIQMPLWYLLCIPGGALCQRKNLSRESIIDTAFQMIDEEWAGEFSLCRLSSRLGVQVSSLYNHIENEHDNPRTC